MGKINRLKRITMARIEAFLETLEKPEYILPQLVREMSEHLKKAFNAKAKALSAVKGAQRRLDEANGKVLRLEKGAKLAVQAEELDTARQAVAAQMDAEKEVQRCQAELEQVENAYEDAGRVYKQLELNLAQLKEKKKELLRKNRQFKLTRQLSEKYTKSILTPGKNIFDVIVRMESRIEQEEIQVEVQSELTKTLGVSFDEQRVRNLEKDSEVDQRLKLIKDQINNESGSD